ncbi:hypothetical protein QDY65_05915 [Pyrococcus kukulkanii]|uniref:hypothetical protein n=1 Tax=Pyrococcus kukulkanii TaxID=1609559 RepID=UPI00356500CA
MRKFVVLLALAVAVLMISGCIGGSVPTKIPMESEVQETTTQEENTQPETQEDYGSWASPWDVSKPVEIDGKKYYITSLKYEYRIRYPGSEEVKEYTVIKERKKTKIEVYGSNFNSESGEIEKVKVGEYEVYEYYTKLIPKSGDVLEVYVWTNGESDVMDMYFTFPVPATMIFAGQNFVAIKLISGDRTYEMYNPAGVGNYNYMPYENGDLGWFTNSEEVENLYGSFFAVYQFPFWSALEEENLYTPAEESFSYMGISYNYRITPQSTVVVAGHKFRTSKVEWTYSFTGQGSAKGYAVLTSSLPVPLQLEGVFAVQGQAWYAYMKLLDIGLKEA